MAKPRKKRFEPVDYSMRTGERRRLTHYLRTGNLKKVAGGEVFGHAIRRNRLILALLAATIIVIGTIYAAR